MAAPNVDEASPSIEPEDPSDAHLLKRAQPQARATAQLNHRLAAFQPTHGARVPPWLPPLIEPHQAREHLRYVPGTLIAGILEHGHPPRGEVAQWTERHGAGRTVCWPAPPGRYARHARIVT